MSIRVRFAPSPTGHIHVGNARTALFNYLLARSVGGTFILRIEDTDLDRSTKESEELIYEDLKWLGLDWDEGEGVGGDKGPYRQTERFDLYNAATQKLLDNGDAYYCFCSIEELEEARQAALSSGNPPLYNGKCSHISREDAEKRIAAGEKAAVRFKVSKPEVTVHDQIHGDVTFPTTAFGDFIIVRPDGVPVYNYAVVVDDALMDVTYVIRGDDHLSNTPKQILIFEALGYKLPMFAHIPMILGPDRSKLSKRHGNTSVEQFRSAGYLPEAMDNFMAMLSWSDKDGEEILSMDELIKRFSMDRVSSSAAVFDFDKLKWLNGMYIRSSELDYIVNLCIPYMVAGGLVSESEAKSDFERIRKIVDSVRDNLEVLGDISSYAAVYYSMPELDDDAKEILALETSRKVLEAFIARLKFKNVDSLSADEYKALVKEVQAETGTKGKPLYMCIRVGVTGMTKGPELDNFIPLMPVKELINRVSTVLEKI